MNKNINHEVKSNRNNKEIRTATYKELKNLVRWTAYTIIYVGYICVLAGYLLEVYHGNVSFDMNTALCISPYLMLVGAFAKVVVPLRIVFIVLSLLILTIFVIYMSCVPR